MDIGLYIVAYIFVSSGVYLAEMQTLKRGTEGKDKKKFKDLDKPSVKSVFGRSFLSFLFLVIANEGFLHWKDLPYFSLALIIGFVTYDLAVFLRDPSSFAILIPGVGEKLEAFFKQNRKPAEPEKKEDDQGTRPKDD